MTLSGSLNLGLCLEPAKLWQAGFQLWGKEFNGQDMLSHHVVSWAASPQAPFPQCMGTLQPSTGFNSDTLLLHLEALVCGSGLQIYLIALSFFFFSWRKLNKD